MRGKASALSVLVDTAYSSEESSVVIAAAFGCVFRFGSTASGMCCGAVGRTPVDQGLAR